ncbi:MAG: ABC transporter permease [Clostridia bacterium]|nr:ABC transporter permease [Clostridia bacterium]
MSILKSIVKRNVKLFFKDKGMFFTSLITPVILLVLYMSFLGNTFEDAFLSTLPAGLENAEALVKGCVGGQLISSILAVSCVTVAFCSNMLMVQDKANGSINDLTITPVKRTTLALGYYFATLISTGIVCLAALGMCLIYVYFVGWYMSFADVLLLIADIFLLVMMGTALSSIINYFLSTQGQISAVGSMVSSVYGFVCGAYMPISQLTDGLQVVIKFLPGTYGTALVRNHAMRGVFSEMEHLNYPKEIIEIFKDSTDCNMYFFDKLVPENVMFIILGATVVVSIGVYVLLNMRSKKK